MTGLLSGVTVRAGDGVAEAHAARLLAELGATPVSSPDPGVAISADGATASVDLVATGGDPDAAERRLQAEWGLAALTGEADGPPTLLGGRPMLHHAGGVAAVAAVLGLVASRRRAAPVGLRVDARAATAGILDDDLMRVAMGGRTRGRWRGVRDREAAGRLVRAADGWVSVTLSHPEEWAALDALAAGDGDRPDAELPLRISARARAWIARRTRREVFELLQAMRLPCGMGLLPAELPTDEHLLADVDIGAAEPASPAPSGSPADAPLAGLRVVELAAMWAGPSAALQLAEWGATVVKVEAPQRLDGFRMEDGARFAMHNRGKRGVLCDASTETGRDRLASLLAEADLLVDAQAPRVLPNWGLDADRLRRLNPRLGVLHLPAVAQAPDDFPQIVAYGFDQEMLCGQAVLGPDEPVRGAGIPLGDPVAAAAAATSLLAVLWRRDTDGAVAHVQLGQRDALLLQVGGRRHAALAGRRWEADALAGMAAPEARGTAAVLADPELRAAGGLADVAAPEGGVLPHPRLGLTLLGGPPPGATTPAPCPGEHDRSPWG